jgi:hypothetical protein
LATKKADFLVSKMEKIPYDRKRRRTAPATHGRVPILRAGILKPAN